MLITKVARLSSFHRTVLCDPHINNYYINFNIKVQYYNKASNPPLLPPLEDHTHVLYYYIHMYTVHLVH